MTGRIRTARWAMLVVVIVGCGGPRTVVELEGGGDSRRGPDKIDAYGCGACHSIPGVRGADAVVAPSLSDFSRRSHIAGRLENTPDNLVAWIMDPQEIDPSTAMPDLGVTEQDARDITAYLQTLGR